MINLALLSWATAYVTADLDTPVNKVKTVQTYFSSFSTSLPA